MDLYIDSKNPDGSYAGTTALQLKGITKKYFVDKQGGRFVPSGFSDEKQHTAVALQTMIEKAERF